MNHLKCVRPGDNMKKKMTKLYTLLEEEDRSLTVKAFHTLPIKIRGTFLFCCSQSVLRMQVAL